MIASKDDSLVAMKLFMMAFANGVAR